MNALGPVDFGAMIPASIEDGKGSMPDVIQTLDFSFPRARSRSLTSDPTATRSYYWPQRLPSIASLGAGSEG